MAAGKFEKDHILNDIIPIEGSVFSVFLPDMPPLFVKVYFYLIYLCCHEEIKLNSAADIAYKLQLTEKDFLAALEHLSQLSLINYTARPFTFEIRSACAAAKNYGAYASNSLSVYADYFAGIRALMPQRSITSSEYDKARDWVEVYGLSPETALMLIAHCTAIKDASISFSYIDKAALSWANNGILTAQDAEEYLTLYSAKTHDAAKLLLHLGIKRVPTADEIALYTKWVSEYGFDLRAIKAACSETTKTAAPSFAYIDRIITSLYNLGLNKENQIKAYLKESDSDRRFASALLYELGERSKTVTSSHVDALKMWRSSGFSDKNLLFAAKLASENGLHSFLRFSQKLNELKDAGRTDAEFITQKFKAAAAPSAKKASADYLGREESYGDSVYTDINDLEV